MNNKIYIGSLHIENYLSFNGTYDFDLRDENGSIYQWTIILGNNNTGKTNFLKAIADLEPIQINAETYIELQGPLNYNQCYPLLTMKAFESTRKDNLSLPELTYSVSSTLFTNTDPEDDKPFARQINKLNVRKNLASGDNEYWGCSFNRWPGGDYDIMKDFKMYGYGVSRRFGESSLIQKSSSANSETLFYNNKTLINIEEWLLQLDYGTKNNDKIARQQLGKLKELIESEIFPEIEDVRFISEATKNYVEFLTNEGWRKLHELGYGYQTTLSWIFDFSKKMFERYPNSDNPLKEPAIVLIDELDLHLHPQWQRQIISFLSNIFAQTQFIVTTHSPFIIQSIEKINLFILDRTNKGIEVHRPAFKTFKGWTIEEILDEIHGLGEKTKSDNYLTLIKQFDKALDTNDYLMAKNAYQKLSEILHPTSPERKLLKVQLSQLISND